MEAEQTPNPEEGVGRAPIEAEAADTNAELQETVEQITIDRWQIANLAGVPTATLYQAAKAMDAASEAMYKALPRHSGFKVGAGGIITGGAIISGQNAELGGLDFGVAEARALHAEQIMTGTGVNLYGLGRDLADGVRSVYEIVAVTADTPGPVYCCGNCLDVLRQFSDENTVIAAGSEAGLVNMVRYSDVLPMDFPQVSVAELSTLQQRLVEEAEAVSKRALTVVTEDQPGPSGVAILGAGGQVHLGARVDGVDYHPTSAMASAVSASMVAGDPFPEAVVFSSKDGRLNGRDRQHIYQLAQGLGRTADLPILLHSQENGTVALTTPEMLLPFGFGWGDIGKSEAVESKLRSFAH